MIRSAAVTPEAIEVADRSGPARLQWLVLWLLGLAAFCSIALPDRVPMVDLPQHARITGLLLGSVTRAPELDYALNPFAPYWLFYLPAMLAGAVMPVYSAAKLSAALWIGLTIPAVGFWLRSAGREPLWAVFAAPTLYCAVTAWGLVGLMAAMPVWCLVGGLSERMIRHSRPRDAWLLGGALVALYFAHPFGWVAGFGLVAGLLALRRPDVSVLAPVIVAAALTGGLSVAFSSGFVETPYFEWIRQADDPAIRFRPERFGWMRLQLGSYGRPFARLPLVDGVLVMALLCAALAWPLRGRWAGSKEGWLWRLRYAAMALILVLATCVGPDQFYFYLRFPLFLGLALPLILPLTPLGPWPMRERLLAGISVVAAGGLIFGAWLEGEHFSDETSCFVELADTVEEPGRVMSVVLAPRPPTYALPVRFQLFALLGLEQGGIPFVEFPQAGVGPVNIRNVDALPPIEVVRVHAEASGVYYPAMGQRYDTIVVSPPLTGERVVGSAHPQYKVSSCGDYGILVRSPGGPR